MWRARSVGRILTLCTVEHDWSRPPPGLEHYADARVSARLVEAADYHGVASCVYQSFRHLAHDPGRVAERLEDHYHGALQSHLRTLVDLAAVRETLDALGTPWLVVKGPVLAEAVYERPDLRAYGDLDLVVPQAAFADVVDALDRSGMPVLDRNWRLVRTEERGQLHLRLPHGTVADLHWNLVNRDRWRFAVDHTGLFERARTVPVNGMPITTLDDNDTLLHLALHAYLSGGDRLLWLKDVERACSRPGRDWSVVVDRAKAWRIGPLVGMMLLRARRSLDAPVPHHVVATLLPSARRQLAEVGNRLHPPERTSSRPSLRRSLARTVGQGSARRLVNIGGSLMNRGRRDADRRNALNPLLSVGGDEGDRAAYFEAVTGSARSQRCGG